MKKIWFAVCALLAMTAGAFGQEFQFLAQPLSEQSAQQPPLFRYMEQAEPSATETAGTQPLFQMLAVADSPVASSTTDCSPARTLNRMLVIYGSKTVVRVQTCDGVAGCRFVDQVRNEMPAVSRKLLDEIQSLKKWRAGNGECDHFVLIDFDDPRHAKLVKELNVRRSELPLLVREANPDYRRKAADLSAGELTKVWNQWFQKPEPEAQQATNEPKCVPIPGAFLQGPRWDYRGPGTLRDHLTDPRGLHHLPKAVVDGWSDAQVQTWHNWHHEVLEKRTPVKSPAKPATLVVYPKTSHTNLESRIRQLAQAEVRRPPAAIFQGADSKKKRNERLRSGSRTNDAAFVEWSLLASGASTPRSIRLLG